MKSEEVLANRENGSDCVTARETAALEATSPSSDSGLSGSICLQLFGDDCPQRVTRKSSHRIQEASASKDLVVLASFEERQSKQSLKSSSGGLGEDKSLLSVKEGSPNEEFASEEVLLSSGGVGEEKPLLSSRTSTQLNQLLYKDDRTEISLVQQLNPEKVPPRKPSVKLQINLHNSIVPVEFEMKSPRSQDKMVETRESFPLHPDWTVDSKMDDKIQQTSENDIYKRLSGDKPRLSKSEQSQCNDDVPEKDCKTNCQCSICLISRLHQPCGCCRCKPPRLPDLDPPDFLLPPPPPPPLRRYRCDCCLYNYHPPYSPQQEFYNQMYQEPFSSALPYQNNDDYLDLVQELEETLHSRNRNRVKRAMHEFESRSKQNKPLERPIIDYDESGDSEEVIRKIDQLRGDKVSVKSKGFKSGLRYGRGQGSRWRMDPDSGEWQKNDSTQTKPTPSPGGKSREVQAGDRCYCSCNCQRNYE